ncbi:MAG: tripartite tricarboxylate transporter TctB family protein [Serratia inhibens]|uniref:tripartite tricarboxylate transporter TctB family protein n=1 Tax=Serratia inhibens TaxID=2338073 RepID=UPI003C7AEDD4
MSDRIFAGLWLLLCIGGLFIGWGIQSEYSYEPLGPRPFPLAILGLMALCAACLLLSRPQVVEWPHRKVMQRLLLLVITLVLYAWGFEWLGFPVATALLTCSIALLFQASLPAAAVSGAIMGVALYYAFDRLLDVTLPLGIWLS